MKNKKDRYISINKNTMRTFLNTLFVIIMTILYVIITRYLYGKMRGYDFQLRGYLVLIFLNILVTSELCSIFGAYNIGIRTITDLSLSRILTMFFTDITMYLILCLIDAQLVLIWPYILLFILDIIVCAISSYISNSIIRTRYLPKKALVIYGGENYKNIVNKLRKYQYYEFNIKKTINEKDVNYNKFKELLEDFECVITIDISHKNKKKIIKNCYENEVNVFDVPSITDVFIKSSEVTNIIDTPLFMMNKMGPSALEKIIKRMMDIFGSIVLIIVTSPIMLIVAIIIRLQDGGRVLFKQKRLTENGKEFELIKFRSMIENAEPEGKMIRAKKDDERITRFGKFMRSTRMDEIPQIFNILKGDMSFVGPRALRVEEYKENEKDFPEFKYRLKVKAGLTGYAQIYGKYNTTFRDKLLLDIYYIENYSLIMDIKLILTTFVTILFKSSTEGF